MEKEYFIGTEIKKDDITNWILSLRGGKRISEIRYFGSRVFGNPRNDSDIDVYLLMRESSREDDFSYGPLFSKMYKGYRVEFHPMIDFYDGYVPTWLLQYSTKNELQTTPAKGD